jgi:hypothetical protein
MLDPKFVVLGSILNLIGTAGYVIDTLKGKVKPNRVSFLLWALAPLIAFSAQINQGVGLQSLMTFMVGFGPLLVLLASFVNKKSVWQLTRFDFFCGGLSLLGLALWMITREGNLAIAFGISADALAAVPTVVKSYKEPESENGRMFLYSAISALITLLTVDVWNFANYAFPLYILTICLLIFSLVEFKLGKKISKFEDNSPKTF